MTEKQSETFWKQICHGGLFLSLRWPCGKRNTPQNIVASLPIAFHSMGWCHTPDDDPDTPWLLVLTGILKWDSVLQFFFRLINAVNTQLVFWFQNSVPIYTPQMKTSDTCSCYVCSTFCCKLRRFRRHKMGFIHTSLGGCLLLHCSLIDLTLAHSLSVIYDQTTPEPGIYYPLLLSVRQHYITLCRSARFTEQQHTGREHCAVRAHACKTSSVTTMSK